MEIPICIIGGGPAGSTASMVLSNAQVPHILLERSVFPRDKVCGECFDGRVMHVLNRVNPELLQSLLHTGILKRSNHQHIQFLNSPWLKFVKKSTPPRPMARRIEFDNALFQAAKANIYCEAHEGVHIVNIERENEQWHIYLKDGRTITARLVVLAAGANTSLLQYFGLHDCNHDTLLFSRGIYTNIVPLPQPQILEIYAVTKPVAGAVFITNHDAQSSNVELGVYELSYKKRKIHLSEALEEVLATHPALRHRFSNAKAISKMVGTSMQLNAHKGSYVAEGAILAGAAAYCLNPITGLGVGNAMKMGEMAGHQAIACFQQQAYTRAHLMLYDKQVRELYKNTGQIDRVINKFLSATVRILP